MSKETENKSRESETIVRLKAMHKAFEAGKLTSLTHPNGEIPERNFEDLPDDTVYAHLKPDQE